MRLFVAIWPPSEAKDALASVQAELRERTPKGQLRFTVAEQIHLTLCFLGEVPEAQVDELGAVLRTGLQKAHSFELRIAGLGAFPSVDRPRVIWAGLKGDVTEAMSLQRLIVETIKPAFKVSDEKQFHPHLTLARVNEGCGRRGQKLGNVIRNAKPPRAEPWNVTGVLWMRSDLHPTGARYTSLMEIPLLITR